MFEFIENSGKPHNSLYTYNKYEGWGGGNKEDEGTVR